MRHMPDLSRAAERLGVEPGMAGGTRRKLIHQIIGEQREILAPDIGTSHGRNRSDHLTKRRGRPLRVTSHILRKTVIA